nr:integrase, catalytic region, zinc finger, CCHC-type, peptidase aspartic, catalytic [Tanacetum cinerariifolium]
MAYLGIAKVALTCIRLVFEGDQGLDCSRVGKKINSCGAPFIGGKVFLGCLSMKQTNSLKPYVLTVILEKIIIDLEDEVVSLLDKEKENLKIIESLKSKGCDQVENSNVIAPGMFKLSVSQSVSPISVTKMSCASSSVETNLKRKSRKRTSSKQLDKQVNKDVLRANKDFVHFLDFDTLSSVRRPKPSGVMWIKKGLSNTVIADLSSINHSSLNKNVKRYSRKNLMACNNFDTRSTFDCNNARNALSNARMNASVDVNDLFVFDDVSIRKSHVSKMPFRKNPNASLNVPSRSKLNKSLPRTVHLSLDHQFRMFNNDFAVIAGYGDVVIGSITIKKVYYVEGLGHNLFSVRQFSDKGLEVAFQKSTCFVRNEDGIDFLTGDRLSNLYTIALNEVASNSLACLLAKASSSQSCLWHQRLFL